MSEADRRPEGASAGAPLEPGADLAAALEPLHASYLRRLNEMAGRIAEGALLREATTRDATGALVLGAEGLPIQFDVADGATGSTFEVRSARYDAPTAAQLTVGTLALELLPGCWEALPLGCTFGGPPMPGDVAALRGLLRAFAEMGSHGAFRTAACAPWSGRIHGLRLSGEGAEVRALFDLGSCPPRALQLLVETLEGFGRHRTPIALVTIGGPVLDAQGAL